MKRSALGARGDAPDSQRRVVNHAQPFVQVPAELVLAGFLNPPLERRSASRWLVRAGA
jgi:hypothetical protein